MTTENKNVIEGCGKEQPAGAETYVCGQPNSKRPTHSWYCRRCNKKYVEHLENRVIELEAELESQPVCKAGDDD